MGKSKELFCKNKELYQQWAAVVSSDWYREVTVYARSEMMDSTLSSEQLAGAKMYERVLFDLTQIETPISEYPAPLLKHDFDKQPLKKKE